jgi:hypothetical protein
MPEQWYYGYSDNRFGPVSGRELQELVDSGRIQPTDTVWINGDENGMAAATIENLFPPDAVEIAEETAQPPLMIENPEPAPVKTEKPPAQAQKQVRKGRVTGIKGAVIVNQDGTTVQYRKQCIKCGTLENSTNRMPIRSGTTRVSYFCKTCRKLRPVEIQGSI